MRQMLVVILRSLGYFKVNEMERLKYRYIDLRSSNMQRNMRFRSSIILQMRSFLCQNNGFTEIETPYLFKITPGESVCINF